MVLNYLRMEIEYLHDCMSIFPDCFKLNSTIIGLMRSPPHDASQSVRVLDYQHHYNIKTESISPGTLFPDMSPLEWS